jgi:DNA-binding NtrC family response regulator
MRILVPSATCAPTLLGGSPAVQRLLREVELAGHADATVLVVGETGSGKELVARLVHSRSARRDEPFVAVNCCGIPETLLESELFGHVRGSFTGAVRDHAGLVRRAEGGTLFLDELGDMSLRMQAVLLRFTESGEVQPVGAMTPSRCHDVRIVAATHRDLGALVRDGSFRQDLYYRMNVLLVRVPPLRERTTDIPLLLRHFMNRACEAYKRSMPTLSGDAEACLVAFDWPGNVRQLRSVAERLAVAAGGRIATVDDLPDELRDADRTLHRPSPVPIATGGSPHPHSYVQPGPVDAAEEAWRRLRAGEDFWSAVYQPFQAHDLRRDDIRALLKRAVDETRGQPGQVPALLNVAPDERRRLLAFLRKYNCGVPAGSRSAALAG